MSRLKINGKVVEVLFESKPGLEATGRGASAILALAMLDRRVHN